MSPASSLFAVNWDSINLMWFLLVPELLRPRGRAGQQPGSAPPVGHHRGQGHPSPVGTTSQRLLALPLSLRTKPPGQAALCGPCGRPEPPHASGCRWINSILLGIGSFSPPLFPILLPGICQPALGPRGCRAGSEGREQELLPKLQMERGAELQQERVWDGAAVPAFGKGPGCRECEADGAGKGSSCGIGAGAVGSRPCRGIGQPGSTGIHRAGPGLLSQPWMLPQSS